MSVFIYRKLDFVIFGELLPPKHKELCDCTFQDSNCLNIFGVQILTFEELLFDCLLEIQS